MIRTIRNFINYRKNRKKLFKIMKDRNIWSKEDRREIDKLLKYKYMTVEDLSLDE